MVYRNRTRQYLVCIGTGGFRASLVIRRAYERLPDPDAEKRGLLRVIAESGEDYLYPTDLFVPIELPAAAGKAFATIR
ncbi:MAG: hypothetical protein NT005_01170 [Spirochaetes bacterium]|nr:hypothetical protein [Spirochaetota bacterium]